jgi:shikimate dehydrogenase
VITGRTALYGVLGHPVRHSRSPELQAAAFEHLAIDAAYVALDVAPERLAEAVVGAHALGFQGLNVTVPHKRAVVPLCGAVDAVAGEVGAVNTLRRTEHGWEGFNTDAAACLMLLREEGLRPGARALLAGAGGAARAAAWALVRAGAELRIAARRPDAAERLAAELSPLVSGGAAAPAAVPWDALAAEADAADAVVNGTTIGLHAGDAPLPLRVRAGQLVLDFVYGETILARAAREAGARLVSGERILVRQGALAFALWTGRAAPEALMAAAIAAPERAT